MPLFAMLIILRDGKYIISAGMLPDRLLSAVNHGESNVRFILIEVQLQVTHRCISILTKLELLDLFVRLADDSRLLSIIPFTEVLLREKIVLICPALTAQSVVSDCRHIPTNSFVV